MNGPIENLYFNWLYSNVADITIKMPSLRYWQLFDKLHRLEYVYFVLGDDNRAADGLDLRTEFINDNNLNHDELLWNIPCSVLEMLVAFSRKASFTTDESSPDWFWVMINNLGLEVFNDATKPNALVIQNIIDVFIWRTYDFHGCGGLFPMPHTQNDQREIEVWYQFNEYLLEIGYD